MPVPVVNLAAPLAQGLMALWHVGAPETLTFPRGVPLAAEYSTVAPAPGGPNGLGVLAAFAFSLPRDSPTTVPFTMLAAGAMPGAPAARAGAVGYNTLAGNQGARLTYDSTFTATATAGGVGAGGAAIVPGAGVPFQDVMTFEKSFTNTVGTFYRNGAQAGTYLITGTMVAPTDPTLVVGFESATGTNPWVTPGSLAMVAVWRRVLTAQEVAALYMNPSALFRGRAKARKVN